MLEKPDTPRMWFVSADGTELIQLQRNRFVRNWRHHAPAAVSPRYPVLRSVSPKISCSLLTSWSRNDSRHFTIGAAPDVFPGDELEDTRVIAKWIMKDGGRPIGRLHVDLRPAYMTENHAPVWNLNLVARGAPLGSGLEGLLQFMDAGRDRIVHAFEQLTTKEMHDEWKKR